MPLSTSSNNSLYENNSFLEFKLPQDSRFRLRTTHWKISDKYLTDFFPSFDVLLVAAFPRMKFCGKIRNKNEKRNIYGFYVVIFYSV
jgi:hypothetical protein